MEVMVFLDEYKMASVLYWTKIAAGKEFARVGFRHFPVVRELCSQSPL
jgi:hypothetical protein